VNPDAALTEDARFMRRRRLIGRCRKDPSWPSCGLAVRDACRQRHEDDPCDEQTERRESQRLAGSHPLN